MLSLVLLLLVLVFFIWLVIKIMHNDVVRWILAVIGFVVVLMFCAQQCGGHARSVSAPPSLGISI